MRIGGPAGDGSIVIFDPEPAQQSPEMKIRPKADHIVQIEMQDLNNYTIYLFPDKEVREFEDIVSMETNLKSYIRSWILKNEKPDLRDLSYDVDEIADRGLSVMANFRLADIDIKNRFAYRVRAPR